MYRKLPLIKIKDKMEKETIIQGFIKKLIEDDIEDGFIGYYTAILVQALEDDDFWEIPDD